MTRLYLKLNVHGLELAEYMHQLHNNKLRFSLYEGYVKLNEIHSHNTRHTQNAVYFKPRLKKSIGKKLLVYRGAKLWKNVDGSIKSLSWYSIKKRFKRRLISNYSSISVGERFCSQPKNYVSDLEHKFGSQPNRKKPSEHQRAMMLRMSAFFTRFLV